MKANEDAISERVRMLQELTERRRRRKARRNEQKRQREAANRSMRQMIGAQREGDRYHEHA